MKTVETGLMADNDFKTATMARIYSSQGYYEKAVRIYKHLLKSEPENQELVRALAGVEKKLQKKTKGGNEELSVMFSKWVDLILLYKRMRDLKKVKGKLEG